MSQTQNLKDKTIADFGDQWKRYTDNEGWYGSLELFQNITMPLLNPTDLQGARVAEIGSGSGRIVGMLLAAGAGHVYAIEPSPDAFEVLKQNISRMPRGNNVTPINASGEAWTVEPELDYILSIGVIHHIPDPAPVVKTAYNALKHGGQLFLWLYGYEGNELYLSLLQPIRKITTRLPHPFLRVLVEILYFLLTIYRYCLKVVPLPLKSYIENVLWPMTPRNRRVVVYDQLNPAYAKYYKKAEAIELLESAGFINIQTHHRYGYSWSVMGEKP